MDIKEVIRFWVKQSDRDFSVASNLFKTKYYAYSLFFCHLTLEKLLKAVIVTHTKKQAPYLHDLLILADKANVRLNKEQKLDFNKITSFNIRARYHDIKDKFYRKANNRNFAHKYLELTKKYKLWLNKEFLKK